MGKTLEERREFRRWDSRIPLQYKRVDRFDELFKGSVAHNIGLGGVKFVTNEFISVTQRLAVILPLPPAKMVTAVSKVVWVRKLPYSDRYEVGAQFTEIGHQEKKKIADFAGAE